MALQTSFLTSEDLSQLGDSGEVVEFQSNARIIGERGKPDSVYWVLGGSVRIEMGRLYRGEALAQVGRGEILGEMSFLDQELSSAAVVANGPVSLLKVPRETLETVLAENDGMAARFYHTVAVTLSRRLRLQANQH